MTVDTETVYGTVLIVVFCGVLLSLFLWDHSGDFGGLRRISLVLIAIGAVVVIARLTDAGESTRKRLGVVVRTSERHAPTTNQQGAETSTGGAQSDAAP